MDLEPRKQNVAPESITFCCERADRLPGGLLSLVWFCSPVILEDLLLYLASLLTLSMSLVWLDALSLSLVTVDPLESLTLKSL